MMTSAAPQTLLSPLQSRRWGLVPRAVTKKEEPQMPTFKLPLSGDVVQSINPFTAFMTGGQFGLININLGQSSDPDVEADVLSDVAPYGKQLGRIGDALLVLLKHFTPRPR
jgi:hypothetical protein